MKKLIFGLFFTLWASLASAGVNCTMPYTFVPGTLADANQVNANYAALVACLLNAAAAGNNNDITALLALTTPITAAAGGSTLYVGGTSGGSANAQTVTPVVPTGFALTAGNSVAFIAGFTNGTGGTQLNVAGTGLKNFYRQTPNGPQAMTGGEVISGNLIFAFYDGTQYEMVSNGPMYGGFGPLTTLDSGGATADLGTVPSHNVTFTAASVGRGITSLGSSASVTFPLYVLNFATALTLTYNATSLILPSSTNITTASGDNAIALYLGAGNWQIISYQKANGTAVVSPTPLCGFSALNVASTTNSNINWSYNSSVLINPTGNVPIFSTAKSGSINITTGTGGTSTAGGMDGTGPGNNTFSYLYAIYNGTTWSAVGSITAPPTGPVMPSGYTHLCYMGAIKTNGSANLYATQILGNEARYISGGTNLTTLPLVTNGTQGSAGCTTATPTYTAFTVRGSTGAGIWMPSTAVAGDYVLNNNFGGGGGTNVLLAPNTSYEGIGLTGGNSAPLAQQTGTLVVVMGRLLFEANTVQYCASTAAGSFNAYGWKDAVNAN